MYNYISIELVKIKKIIDITILIKETIVHWLYNTKIYSPRTTVLHRLTHILTKDNKLGIKNITASITKGSIFFELLDIE